jgi:hypothetical protein
MVKEKNLRKVEEEKAKKGEEMKAKKGRSGPETGRKHERFWTTANLNLHCTIVQ